MKMTSIFTASVASAALVMASAVSAATVVTMTAEATQVIKVPGCKVVDINAPLTMLTATFDDNGSFQIVDDVVPTPNVVLQGTWFKLAGKTPTSPYTIYMTPSIYAPAPDDVGNNQDPDPAPVPAGTLDDFLAQVEVIAETGMTCKLKGAGTQSITLLQPSTLIVNNTLKVTTNKDSSKSGTLTFQTKGKQSNMFTGVSQTKTFSTKMTIKAPVIES